MFHGLPGAVQRMLNSAQSVSLLLTHSCNLTSHGLKGKQYKAEAEEVYLEKESAFKCLNRWFCLSRSRLLFSPRGVWKSTRFPISPETQTTASGRMWSQSWLLLGYCVWGSWSVGFILATLLSSMCLSVPAWSITCQCSGPSVLLPGPCSLTHFPTDELSGLDMICLCSSVPCLQSHVCISEFWMLPFASTK